MSCLVSVFCHIFFFIRRFQLIRFPFFAYTKDNLKRVLVKEMQIRLKQTHHMYLDLNFVRRTRVFKIKRLTSGAQTNYKVKEH